MPYTKERNIYIMKYYSIIFISLLFSDVQFTDHKNKTIQESLIAPCCGGGIIYEHENNSIIKGMKKIIKTLTNDVSSGNQGIIINQIADYYTKNADKMTYAPPIISYNELINLLNTEINSPVTNNSIVNLFEKIHGPIILSVPNNSAFGSFAWLFPSIILLLFLIYGIFMIYKLKTK